MSVVETGVEPRRPSRSERIKQRDLARGYAINPKYLGIAFLAEIMVIGTSLFGAYLFATKYTESGHLSWADFWMMMLAPFSYAVIEMCRVPLALAFRTQANYFIKLLAFIGVVAAAGVTVKSMSQLGEIMFRPRLIEVTEAKHDLDKIQATKANFQGQYDDKKKILDAANANVANVQESMNKQSETLAVIGKTVMCPVYVTRNKRRVQTGTAPCKASGATTEVTKVLRDQGPQLQAALIEAKAAREALDKLGTSETMEAEVVKARGVFDKAVMHSQLHAFTGMFFGKAPSEVSDGELSGFLRIFVFIPAICVSLSSTLLAMAAVNKIRPPKPVKDPNAAVDLHPDASRYILDPLVEQIVSEATAAAHKDVRDTVERHRHAASTVTALPTPTVPSTQAPAALIKSA